MLRPVCSGDSPARSARNAVLGEEHSLVPLGLSCIARAIRVQTHIQCMLVCASRSFDIVAHLATLDVVEFICEATSARIPAHHQSLLGTRRLDWRHGGTRHWRAVAFILSFSALCSTNKLWTA